MKTLLVFSNPFGYGPSGKALTVAKFIKLHTHNTRVIICGGKLFLGIAGQEFQKLEVNDRSEEDLNSLLDNISGECYIFSSQNRFAIKSALKRGLDCAFLDGLAWFWSKIPEDHFIADQIFWLNYPDIENKIPLKYSDKINLISGIDDVDIVRSQKKLGILFYIGGCNNPLTPIPKSYLDLSAKLLHSAIQKNLPIKVASDTNTLKYLSKYRFLEKILKNYSHSNFLKQIAKAYLFVTNGGQTASLEAVSLKTNLAFYLPANLSQYALQVKTLNENSKYPVISWDSYIELPSNFKELSEKEAILLVNSLSKKIINNKKTLGLLSNNFINFLTENSNIDKTLEPPSFLASVGSSGAKEVFNILKQKWGLS